MSGIRVGTFNGKFLPHLPSNKRRATLLAERIARYDYDVIALSEVFSDRARNALIDGLATQYPHSVQYIGSEKWLREDSGLMLFSKLPFDHLPPPGPFAHKKLRARSAGRDWPHVWFVEYDECCSSDCLAGKGAAYVLARLNDRPLHIFFTHMQAKYDFHTEEKQRRTRSIRRAQLAQMSSLIEHALADGNASTDNVLILGDFNVDGERSQVEPSGGPTESTDSEWSEALDMLNRLFPNGVLDVWDSHAPVEDAGHTYSPREPHARRDYILLSSPDTHDPLCVHHASLAHNLIGDEGAGPDEPEMSDHLGINVYINRPAPACHPGIATEIEAVNDTLSVAGRIAHPGGLQWFRVCAEGSLLVGPAEGSNVAAVEVFAATDISRPMSWTTPDRGGAASGNGNLRHYSNVGTCYIRVGDAKNSPVGDYRLTICHGGS